MPRKLTEDSVRVLIAQAARWAGCVATTSLRERWRNTIAYQLQSKPNCISDSALLVLRIIKLRAVYCEYLRPWSYVKACCRTWSLMLYSRIEHNTIIARVCVLRTLVIYGFDNYQFWHCSVFQVKVLYEWVKTVLQWYSLHLLMKLWLSGSTLWSKVIITKGPGVRTSRSTPAKCVPPSIDKVVYATIHSAN